MEGLELLAISLCILFGFGMILSILLWCRSWRKEDREQTEQQVRALRGSIRKLTDADEMLDHTAASLQTADGLLTQQLEDLRSSITRLQSVRPQAEAAVKAEPEARPAAAEPTESAQPETSEAETPGSYDAVNDLLKQGRSTLEIARELDIGVAEVRMIARMRANDNPNDPASKELIERG